MANWQPWDDIFPDAEVGFCTETGFFKREVAHQCSDCGTGTVWFHTSIMLYFCSERCYRTFKRRPPVGD